MIDRFSVVFWDFDGVIIDSNRIRNSGFSKVLKEFPDSQVKELLDFHNKNGGLSRYVKFRYFFEKIRGEKISASEVDVWSEKFSTLMKGLLLDSNLLIKDTLSTLEERKGNCTMHVVSGSDQSELRFLLKEHNLSHYFKTIEGSPTPKTTLVSNILNKNNYTLSRCVLIGDSINDYEAAVNNGISFIGYNNLNLKDLIDNKNIFYKDTIRLESR